VNKAVSSFSRRRSRPADLDNTVLVTYLGRPRLEPVLWAIFIAIHCNCQAVCTINLTVGRHAKISRA
jgi:hypothetical protein